MHYVWNHSWYLMHSPYKCELLPPFYRGSKWGCDKFLRLLWNLSLRSWFRDRERKRPIMLTFQERWKNKHREYLGHTKFFFFFFFFELCVLRFIVLWKIVLEGFWDNEKKILFSPTRDARKTRDQLLQGHSPFFSFNYCW